jgi:hypothetical protein
MRTQRNFHAERNFRLCAWKNLSVRKEISGCPHLRFAEIQRFEDSTIQSPNFIARADLQSVRAAFIP